jgi:hypothetical protein
MCGNRPSRLPRGRSSLHRIRRSMEIIRILGDVPPPAKTITSASAWNSSRSDAKNRAWTRSSAGSALIPCRTHLSDHRMDRDFISVSDILHGSRPMARSFSKQVIRDAIPTLHFAITTAELSRSRWIRLRESDPVKGAKPASEPRIGRTRTHPLPPAAVRERRCHVSATSSCACYA